MIKALVSTLRVKIVRYFLLYWRSDLITIDVHCHIVIVYRIYENLFIYDTFFKSQFRFKKCSRKLFSVAEDDLIQYLKKRL